MVLIYVLDTNIVLYFLGGRLAQGLPDGTISISVITEMELLSYPGLSQADEKQIKDFIGKVNLIDLTPNIRSEAVRLRQRHRLKLPDAIIAATAVTLGATILTNDLKLANLSGLLAETPEILD